MFNYERAGRSADVGRELERGRPLAQLGRTSEASEREGAFGNAVIAAEARYSLVTEHYRPGRTKPIFATVGSCVHDRWYKSRAVEAPTMPEDQNAETPTRLTVEANGLEFECLRAGTGDRLALCLHGFPDDAGSMHPLLDRLARRR